VFEKRQRPPTSRELIARMALFEVGKRSIEHGLSDDEFADKIHYGIDARGIDAQAAIRGRDNRGTGSDGLHSGFGGFSSSGGGCSGSTLRLQ